jgi:hypothetical protein
VYFYEGEWIGLQDLVNLLEFLPGLHTLTYSVPYRSYLNFFLGDNRKESFSINFYRRLQGLNFETFSREFSGFLCLLQGSDIAIKV